MKLVPGDININNIISGPKGFDKQFSVDDTDLIWKKNDVIRIKYVEVLPAAYKKIAKYSDLFVSTNQPRNDISLLYYFNGIFIEFKMYKYFTPELLKPHIPQLYFKPNLPFVPSKKEKVKQMEKIENAKKINVNT